MVVLAVPLHLGALHPVESLLMAALALGPFVALAGVVTVVSRRDRRAERTEPDRRRRAGQATRTDRVWLDAGTSATTETAAPQSVQQ